MNNIFSVFLFLLIGAIGGFVSAHLIREFLNVIGMFKSRQTAVFGLFIFAFGFAIPTFVFSSKVKDLCTAFYAHDSSAELIVLFWCLIAGMMIFILWDIYARGFNDPKLGTLQHPYVIGNLDVLCALQGICGMWKFEGNTYHSVYVQFGAQLWEITEEGPYNDDLALPSFPTNTVLPLRKKQMYRLKVGNTCFELRVV